VNEILKEIKKSAPDILFSMMALPSIYEDTDVLGAVKRELPNTLIVACGSVCNAIPEDVLKGGGVDLAAYDSFPYTHSLRILLENCKRSDDPRKLSNFSYIKDNMINPVSAILDLFNVSFI
jgi:hypothetical protein